MWPCAVITPFLTSLAPLSAPPPLRSLRLGSELHSLPPQGNLFYPQGLNAPKHQWLPIHISRPDITSLLQTLPSSCSANITPWKSLTCSSFIHACLHGWPFNPSHVQYRNMESFLLPPSLPLPPPSTTSPTFSTMEVFFKEA